MKPTATKPETPARDDGFIRNRPNHEATDFNANFTGKCKKEKDLKRKVKKKKEAMKKNAKKSGNNGPLFFGIIR